jgi:hypothetical protein
MTTALEGSEGSASRTGRYLPPGKPDTHCTGGWVGPRVGLDRCEKSRPHRDFFYSLLHLINVSVQCLIHAMTVKLRLTSKFSSEEVKFNIAKLLCILHVFPTQASSKKYQLPFSVVYCPRLWTFNIITGHETVILIESPHSQVPLGQIMHWYAQGAS